MEKTLNEGPGICQGTHRLLIKPVMAVISLGAVDDVVSEGMRVVHRLNRRGDTTDFIAVALPGMTKIQGRYVTGTELELIGSETSLQAVLDADVVRRMIRRGMVEDMSIEPVQVTPGETGVAYVRDQSCAYRTVGRQMRKQRRIERKIADGTFKGDASKLKMRSPRGYDTSDLLTVVYNEIPVHITEHVMPYEGATIKVNTYGLTTKETIAPLPVRPHKSKINVAAAA